jgi:hypothetical protein
MPTVEELSDEAFDQAIAELLDSERPDEPGGADEPGDR